MEENTSFFADPHAWVLFSTIIFAILAWKKGKQPLLDMLDARTSRIKAELEEAERLKNEAQKLLADYQKKHQDAVETAKKILDNAQESVVLMQKEAEEKLAENLKRRETLLLERIARAEASAVQELRNQAADIAATAAGHLLSEAMGKRDSKLVDAAIEELPARMN